jgi:hypothetical protein
MEIKEVLGFVIFVSFVAWIYREQIKAFFKKE